MNRSWLCYVAQTSLEFEILLPQSPRPRSLVLFTRSEPNSFLKTFLNEEKGMLAHAFSFSWQKDLCKFRTSLIYTVSSSAVRGTHRSCRGPELSSQHLHGDSQTCATRVAGDPTTSPDPPPGTAPMQCTYMCVQQPHTHKINSFQEIK